MDLSHIQGDRPMIQTFEAVIDEDGHVKLLQEVKIAKSRRALVTILDEDPSPHSQETALLSESVLAEDWLKPEEEEAWDHLQPDRSS